MALKKSFLVEEGIKVDLNQDDGGAPRKPVRAKRTEPFLPVTSLSVIHRLCQLGGKCLEVGLALWSAFVRHGNKGPVKLSNLAMDDFGTSRQAKNAALKSMQDAGLIYVRWSDHRSPIVWLADPDVWDARKPLIIDDEEE
jgi:hypothetical protein